MQLVPFVGRHPVAGSALIAVFLCGSLLASAAAAEDEPTASEVSDRSPYSSGSLSLGALAGLTQGNRLGSGSARTLFGYGGRAGYRFSATPLYLGFTVFHRQDDVPEDPGETEQRVTVDLDVGGEIAFGQLIVRPYAGLGALLDIYDGGAESGSAIVPLFVPGVLTRYLLGVVDVGVDVRWEALSSPWGASLCVLGSVGLRL